MIASTVLCLLAFSRLLWHDEFDGSRGTKPDPAKWTYDVGGNGWGNRELEIYTRDPANASLDGQGHLVIQALRNSNGAITSARLKTEGLFSFTYGRVEARIKVSRGQGFWPAFWMLGTNITEAHWPQCGEIDVMENIGREPKTVHGTIHGPGYSGKNGISSQLTMARALAGGFHVYRVDWSPGKIVFRLDGKRYAQVTPRSLPPNTKWVYNHPFFLLLDLAVGGAWPGNPDATSIFPQQTIVDYVRIYGARIPTNPKRR